jgi:hypothetical protein
MADPALTVADLEIQKTSENALESNPSISTKETEIISLHQSILKKSKTSEPKKVLFSDPENYAVHEISITKPHPSSSTSAESKETPEKETGTLEKQSSGNESLKTLSMLSSQGLLKSNSGMIQSAQDLRWKANSISTRHLNTKHYEQSPCEIFRQRLNACYARSIKRNINKSEFELKKPEFGPHIATAANRIIVVRGSNNSNS